jgi:hypothetical protein
MRGYSLLSDSVRFVFGYIPATSCLDLVDGAIDEFSCRPDNGQRFNDCHRHACLLLRMRCVNGSTASWIASAYCTESTPLLNKLSVLFIRVV